MMMIMMNPRSYKIQSLFSTTHSYFLRYYDCHSGTKQAKSYLKDDACDEPVLDQEEERFVLCADDRDPDLPLE